MLRLIFIALFTVLFGNIAHGQRKIVHLPDLPGFVTLKCDLHLHTVFSDADVWPTIRIDEALRDGLDAIAITDHLEYTPRKDIIPPDHNAAWKIAEKYAGERNLILVHGTEITRFKMPPGHFNALFIKDASLILKDSVWDSFEAAIKQEAFLHWNHPWYDTLYDVHKRLIENGWLHGIEIFNAKDYFPQVFNMCRKNNLVIMGNSDSHGLISETYTKPNYLYRPMTLVLAREKSKEGLKEALFAGRTIVWFRDILAAKKEFAEPFFYACISVDKPYYQNDKNLFFEVTNNSDIPFYLINGVDDAPESVTLAANSVTRIAISKKITMPLAYDVKNVHIGENEVLKIELKY